MPLELPQPDTTIHDVVVPSRGVAREIHAQSIREQRDRVLKRLPLVVAGVVLWRFARWHVETVSFFLLGLATVWTGSAAIEWWQLRRADPVEAVTADRLHKLEQARHEQRLMSTTLAMTYGLIGAIGAVWAFQMLTGGLVRSIAMAGLLKPAVKSGHQWWRLLTATYLHGSLWHFWTNMAALRGLGGTIESYDRRLRLPLVYLLCAIGGSLVSTTFVAKTSVGASGGIIGLCGYLFVLASRQPHVAPAWIRSWMIAAFVGTGLLGLMGFFFIDNAAHLGGAVTGLLCGVTMIPAEGRSTPPARERLLDTLGWAAALILLGGAAFTVRQLIG